MNFFKIRWTHVDFPFPSSQQLHLMARTAFPLAKAPELTQTLNNQTHVVRIGAAVGSRPHQLRAQSIAPSNNNLPPIQKRIDSRPVKTNPPAPHPIHRLHRHLIELKKATAPLPTRPRQPFQAPQPLPQPPLAPLLQLQKALGRDVWCLLSNWKVIEISYITDYIWWCNCPFFNLIGSVIEMKKKWKNQLHYFYLR